MEMRLRAPTVSGLNSAGWWINGRKMHAGRRIIFKRKSEKNAKFGKNMDNLVFGALFG